MLFESMRGERVQRNSVTYEAAIRVCENGGQWQQALELFEGMLDEGVRGNTMTYIAAIIACGKGEQWQQALELFARTVDVYAGKNIETLSLMVSK